MKLQYRNSGIPGAMNNRRIPIGYTFAGGKTYTPNGAREVTRRQRQIAAETLQLSK